MDLTVPSFISRNVPFSFFSSFLGYLKRVNFDVLSAGARPYARQLEKLEHCI